MSHRHKVHVTARIGPDTADALQKYCVAHHQNRSQVIDQAVRAWIFPEHHEERQMVIHENLNQLIWQQRRQDQMIERQFEIVKEMFGLFVRQFYFYTPQMPEPQRKAAAASGSQRYARFLEYVANNLKSGASVLEEAPLLMTGEPPRDLGQGVEDDS